jgi:hypothetical protein
MMYGLLYLAVGIAIGLWVVFSPNETGWVANIRNIVGSVYIFAPIVYHAHSFTNDPYVSLGILIILLSSALAYAHDRKRSLGVVYVAFSVIWLIWTLLLFAHRATEAAFGWLLVATLIVWAAQIVVVAKADRETGAYDR